MHFESRGVRAVSRARLLAPIAILFYIGTGCLSQRKSAAPEMPCFVRLEPLLSLHPAWKQVARNDALAARVNALSRPEVSSVVFPQPPPVTYSTDIPPQQIESRQKRQREDAERYVRQLKEFLLARNKEQVVRDVQTFQRAERARLTREAEQRDAQERSMRDTFAQQDRQLRAESQRLEVRAIVFRLNVEQFTGQLRKDSEIMLEQVEREKRAVDEKRTTLASELEQKVAHLRKSREAEFAETVQRYKQQREAELQESMERLLAGEMERLKIESEAIAPLSDALPETLKPEALAVPASPDAKAAFARAMPGWERALERERTVWKEQKARLIALIRQETEQAVRQVAAQQGWKLVLPGTPGAQDATGAVARLLRGQWKNAP